jgi:hypothetical protein
VLRYAVRKSNPLYGHWFFKFYYEAFAEPLQILSKKFRPETKSAIDELLDCRSRIVYERKTDSQVFYILPVESILGMLPVVPVGDTGTIPYSMLQHAADFVGAAFDTREGAGSWWWYINTCALSWSRERGEK